MNIPCISAQKLNIVPHDLIDPKYAQAPFTRYKYLFFCQLQYIAKKCANVIMDLLRSNDLQDHTDRQETRISWSIQYDE